MTADDACADMDAHATAAALADLLGKVGEYDLILCGDGSADNYAQQVDVQLAAKLGLPVVNGAAKIELGAGVATVDVFSKTLSRPSRFLCPPSSLSFPTLLCPASRAWRTFLLQARSL